MVEESIRSGRVCIGDGYRSGIGGVYKKLYSRG